ncbi:MAG: hypothetical protein JWN08_2255 [Frankiales bacterium]|nr:hypothetical protein [Frankiales bacterium]
MIRTPRLVAGAAGLLLAVGLVGASPATAAPGDIHPGVMTFTAGAQCTANFVFSNGTDTFLGQAAHCSGTGGATETDGCQAGSLPLGTPVEVDGATRPGTMVYNSWLTMQAAGESDPSTCAYNDFALIRIDPADVASVSPAIPVLGGPTGIDRDGVALGEQVFSYGNSGLRQGVSQLSPKQGVSLGTDSDGWNHPVYTITPGVPGDSGSAVLSSEGEALGVLSTLALAPLALSNGVSDLGKALDYANARGGLGTIALSQGGAFDGSLPIVRGLLG